MQAVPLDLYDARDPARRSAVVSGFDLDASVQMHRSFAVLVIAKRFQRQGFQLGFLFREHGHHLSLRGAMNARIGPAFFPAVEV